MGDTVREGGNTNLKSGTTMGQPVWRLETFGFLFSPRLTNNDRKHLNQYLK